MYKILPMKPDLQCVCMCIVYCAYIVRVFKFITCFNNEYL